MSPALRALIDADNQRPGPSDGVRTGVYAALGVSLGVLPAGAIAAAQAATTTTTAAATTAAATPAGSAAASTVVGAAKVMGPLAFLAKAPLIGVGVGAVLGATLTAYIVGSSRSSNNPRTERAPVAAQVAPAVPATSAPPPPAIEPPPAAEPAPTLATPPARLTKAPAVARRVTTPAAPVAERAEELPKAAVSGALAAEQSLLDPARAALARGDGAAALSRLALHERRFPAGLLSQEREAMAVRALVLTGARAEAERRAASFRSRFPGSLLGPTIDSTLRGDATLRGRP